MDFKNTITVTHEKLKFLIEKSDIINIHEVMEKNYTTNTDEARCYIIIHFQTLIKLGLTQNRYAQIDMHGHTPLKVDENFNILAGLLRGDQAATALFGQK